MSSEGPKATLPALGGPKPAGGHAFAFTAGDLPSGTYVCRLKAGDRSQTKRLSLIR